MVVVQAVLWTSLGASGAERAARSVLALTAIDRVTGRQQAARTPVGWHSDSVTFHASTAARERNLPLRAPRVQRARTQFTSRGRPRNPEEGGRTFDTYLPEAT